MPRFGTTSVFSFVVPSTSLSPFLEEARHRGRLPPLFGNPPVEEPCVPIYRRWVTRSHHGRFGALMRLGSTGSISLHPPSGWGTWAVLLFLGRQLIGHVVSNPGYDGRRRGTFFPAPPFVCVFHSSKGWARSEKPVPARLAPRPIEEEGLRPASSPPFLFCRPSCCRGSFRPLLNPHARCSANLGLLLVGLLSRRSADSFFFFFTIGRELPHGRRAL